MPTAGGKKELPEGRRKSDDGNGKRDVGNGERDDGNIIKTSPFGGGGSRRSPARRLSVGAAPANPHPALASPFGGGGSRRSPARRLTVGAAPANPHPALASPFGGGCSRRSPARRLSVGSVPRIRPILAFSPVLAVGADALGGPRAALSQYKGHGRVRTQPGCGPAQFIFSRYLILSRLPEASAPAIHVDNLQFRTIPLIPPGRHFRPHSRCTRRSAG